MSFSSGIPSAEAPHFDTVRSERGASIVLALVFFLVCAVVSGIIIGSASVNAERSNQEIKEEQAYLDLKSSANMVKALFYPATTSQNATVDFTNPANPTYKGPATLNESGDGSDIAGWIKASTIAVKNGGAASTLDITIQGSSPFADVYTSPEPVAATFSMDGEYKITVKLQLSDQSNNGTVMVVSIPATNNLDTVPPTVTWSDTKQPSIEREEAHA